MDVLTNEDEIEYFEFLPIAFTTELYEELLSNLNEVVQGYHVHQKIHLHLQESFKKNFFIFNNFVLRNILKFPGHFKLERKATDKIIDADISQLLTLVNEKHDKIKELKSEILEFKAKMVYQTNRRNGYIKLLEEKEKFIDMCSQAKEIKKFLRETHDLYEKYKLSKRKKDSEFDKLLEYKNIKSEYYKNERSRLLEIADFESIDHFYKNL